MDWGERVETAEFKRRERARRYEPPRVDDLGSFQQLTGSQNPGTNMEGVNLKSLPN